MEPAGLGSPPEGVSGAGWGQELRGDPGSGLAASLTGSDGPSPANLAECSPVQVGGAGWFSDSAPLKQTMSTQRLQALGVHDSCFWVSCWHLLPSYLPGLGHSNFAPSWSRPDRSLAAHSDSRSSGCLAPPLPLSPLRLCWPQAGPRGYGTRPCPSQPYPLGAWAGRGTQGAWEVCMDS